MLAETRDVLIKNCIYMKEIKVVIFSSLMIMTITNFLRSEFFLLY